MTVACSIFIKRELEPDLYRYERLWVDGWHSDGRLRLPQAPAPGDRLFVTGRIGDGERAGVFEVRVEERRWEPPAYGSMAWPYGTPEPLTPTPVELICQETVTPMFAGEA